MVRCQPPDRLSTTQSLDLAVHGQVVEQDVDAPALDFCDFGREGVAHRRVQAQAQQVFRRVLRREGDDQPARPGDGSDGGFVHARHDAKQRGLAAPVRSDKAEAVALGNGEAQSGKQGLATGEREIFYGDQGHGSLVRSGCRKG